MILGYNKTRAIVPVKMISRQIRDEVSKLSLLFILYHEVQVQYC